MADDRGYSENEYEIEQGYHTHTDKSGRERRLGPGDRFHPTKKQEEEGALEGKARCVNRAGESAQTTGADIGIRSLPMTPTALEEALEADLKEEDFEGVEPGGERGDYLVSQVRDIIAAKEEAEEAEPEASGEEQPEEGGEEESAEEDEGEGEEEGPVEFSGYLFETRRDAELAEQELDELASMERVEPSAETPAGPAYEAQDVSEAIRLEGEAQEGDEQPEGDAEEGGEDDEEG